MTIFFVSPCKMQNFLACNAFMLPEQTKLKTFCVEIRIICAAAPGYAYLFSNVVEESCIQ